MRVSVRTQLALVAYLTPLMTIRLIPMLNYLWFIGRIMFALTYPDYRGAGFSLTVCPTTIALCYVLFKLFATELF